MSAEAFLDSNILVYTFDNVATRKRLIARDLVARALREGSGVISYQVVQEVLNVPTCKLDPSMDVRDAMRYLEITLEPLWRVQPSADHVRSALSLQARYSLSFYDSLIVAAALSAGCKRLLSEDLQHGLRVEGLTVENPFQR